MSNCQPLADPILVSKRNDTRPVGRELRITHAVLDSTLSPLARLIPATVELLATGDASYADLCAILPCRRGAIRPALNELIAAGFLSMAERKRRHHGRSFYFETSRFALGDSANPHRSPYTRLPLGDHLDGAATRWILRTLYFREQAKRGAVQLPDGIAARRSGMTATKAVRAARIDWQATGELAELQRSSRTRPGIYVMPAAPYPIRADFDPGHYQLHNVTRGERRVQVWATRNQAAKASALLSRSQTSDDEAAAILDTAHSPATAAELLTRLERIGADIPR